MQGQEASRGNKSLRSPRSWQALTGQRALPDGFPAKGADVPAAATGPTFDVLGDAASRSLQKLGTVSIATVGTTPGGRREVRFIGGQGSPPHNCLVVSIAPILGLCNPKSPRNAVVGEVVPRFCHQRVRSTFQQVLFHVTHALRETPH